VATAFTDPGETTTVLDESGGCRRITLSAPNYRREGSHLQFEVKAKARLGTTIGNTCWDAFMVYTVTSLSLDQLAAGDRRCLLDTLLTIRYQFITALAKNGTGKNVATFYLFCRNV
jgi:hypothetical protein